MSPILHLYLHLPFCAKICPYCAFYVQVGGASKQRELVAALQAELVHAQKEFSLKPKTIFFGGGTPSLLSPELFAQLAATLPSLPNDGEFTLEVNPATVTPAKAQAWRQAGVNRISLGAQSFDADLLKLLGRQHRPEEIPETMALLRAHGFSNINLDLMFALPGQSIAQWETTLRAALDCHPQHISAYALTYEADTPFFEQLQLGNYQQNEEREIALFELTRAVLLEHSLHEYEISNFAQPGYESRHNLAYWRGADYLGIGPSAVSTIGHHRWKSVPDTAAYVAALQRQDFNTIRTERETLDPATRMKERILFGLRLREGVGLSEFTGREEKLGWLEKQGLVEITPSSRVVLTPRGKLVADSVAEELI